MQKVRGVLDRGNAMQNSPYPEPFEKTVDAIYLATKGSYAGAAHGRGQ